ncbi:universal stress protein [Microvirga arabica]|uniref:Universal stress protein n=1 Tax=Microvirga arabica TaxID=1128671 RepID=A0ABV6YGP2_9HYPH
MQVQDFVVHLSPRPSGGVDHGGQYAIGLAHSHSSRVTALAQEIIPRPSAINLDVADPAEAVLEEIRHEANRTAEAFAAVATEASVAFETVAERSYAHGIGEVFADYARVRDLAVLGISRPLPPEQRLLAETALLDSGRPLVLVPEQVPVFAQERIVAAWDATPAAVRAIAGAMPFLKAAREVVVVSVLEDKAFRRGESGVEMCRHLARHGVAATFETVARAEREVPTALLDAAQSHGADLLVMGGYAHSTLRGLIFGSATKGVLENPFPLPILMAH